MINYIRRRLIYWALSKLEIRLFELRRGSWSNRFLFDLQKVIEKAPEGTMKKPVDLALKYNEWAIVFTEKGHYMPPATSTGRIILHDK